MTGFKPVKLTLAFIVTIAAMLLFSVTTTPSASAAPKTGSFTQDITDQLPAGSDDYTATMTLTRVTNDGGDLVADATVTVTDAAGNVETQAFPGLEALQATNGTCDVLNLVLGPLHLDLLGLVVDLNQVELNITAEQGPGNLLGNLLCAVAGILDGPSPLGAIAGLLNRILSILG